MSLSALEQLMELAQVGRPWKICLWDWSGFTRMHPDLALDFDRFQVHQSPFCQFVKSSPLGLQRCLRCRQAAGFRASRMGPLQGSCHMGLTELSWPILMDGELMGVLFGGQVHAKGSGEAPLAALRVKARHLHLDTARLARLHRSVPKAGKGQLAELRIWLGLIAKFILAMARADPPHRLARRLPRVAEHQEVASMRGPVRRQWLARRGVEIARLEYNKPLSTQRVAARLGVSLPLFCRSFKEEVGRPFKAYLQDLRVEAAARLLIESPSNVNYIGSEVGFADPNFFSRVFHLKKGLSPSAFREKHWKIRKLVPVK